MLLLPQKAGPITLMRRIGSDGISESYVGILDEPAGKSVLVRQVHPHVLRDPGRLAAFETRASDLLAAKHASLAPVLRNLALGEERYVIEEWVDGVPLDRVIRWCAARHRPIPSNVFLSLATQICNGLEALHSRPGTASGSESILHLALQPRALTLTAEGKVVLGSYGLVRSPTAIPQSEGGVPPSLEYLSPEQTHLDQKLGPPSDVFALGALLYELLTSKPMFRAESPLQTIHKVRRAEVTTHLLEVKELLPGLDRVLYRALSLNPRHRYQRAFVLREDLRGLMAGFTFANIVEETREFLAPMLDVGREQDDVRVEPVGTPTPEPAAPRSAMSAPLRIADFRGSEPSRPPGASPYGGTPIGGVHLDPGPSRSPPSQPPEPQLRGTVPPPPQRADAMNPVDPAAPRSLTVPPAPVRGAPAYNPPRKPILWEPEDAHPTTGTTTNAIGEVASLDTELPTENLERDPLPADSTTDQPLGGADTAWVERPQPADPVNARVLVESARPAAPRTAPGGRLGSAPPPAARSATGPQRLAPVNASALGADSLQEEDDEPKRGWIPALVIGGGLIVGLTLVALCAFGGIFQAVTGMGTVAVAEGTPPAPIPITPIPAAPIEPEVAATAAGEAAPAAAIEAPPEAPQPAVAQVPEPEPEPAAPRPTPVPVVAPAPRPAPVAAAPRPAPVPAAPRPAPVKTATLAPRPAPAPVVARPAPPAPPAPPLVVDSAALASYSTRASSGGLTAGDRAALEGVATTDANYTRSLTLLYQDAKARNDAASRKVYLDRLMAVPESQYKPELLVEQAQMAFSRQDYDGALRYAARAEQHWARLPTDLVFSRKAMIYEIQGAAWTARFNRSEGADATALESAIAAWEKYRTHVASQPAQGLGPKAEQQLARLYDAQKRLQ